MQQPVLFDRDGLYYLILKLDSGKQSLKLNFGSVESPCCLSRFYFIIICLQFLLTRWEIYLFIIPWFDHLFSHLFYLLVSWWMELSEIFGRKIQVFLSLLDKMIKYVCWGSISMPWNLEHLLNCGNNVSTDCWEAFGE